MLLLLLFTSKDTVHRAEPIGRAHREVSQKEIGTPH